MPTMNPTCAVCGNEIGGGDSFKFYGVSGGDLLKMLLWLEVNNATIADLENSTLNYKFWNKQVIFNAMMEKP